MKRVISFLCLMTVLTTSSCGGASTVDDVIPKDGTTAEPVTTASDYDYPQADYQGYEFTFLSLEPQTWANAMIAPEELTGDLVSDAMFERNSRVGERYNVTISEDRRAMSDVAGVLQQSVAAGDDVFDVCMLPLHQAGNVLSENYIIDLKTVSTLHLEKPWWDKAANESIELMGHLYMTTSDISFFPFEATWAIFFNEDRFAEIKLDAPYQLVRDGKWTIDKLIEYAKACADLKGDDAFNPYKEAGKALYGFCSHHDYPLALTYGSEGKYITIENNKPVFTGDSEKMFAIYEKIVALTSAEGAYWNWDFNAGIENGIVGQFMNGRYTMFSETLGYLNNLRSFNGNFGVLPNPKFDEKQENYHSIIASWGTTMTTIPMTASDPERTGVILDALAYDSYKNLMEPYYDTYLMQKGVRNEDAAEMLGLIRETRGIVTDVAYGWASSLNDTLKAQLKLGNGEIASIIASGKSAAIEKANKTLDSMQ